MTPEEKEKYKRLQFLIYALQLEDEEWPLEKPSKEEARQEVINLELSLGFNLNPGDPNFLSKIQEKINEILSQKLPAGNLPPKSIIADFEEKLTQDQEERVRATFPTLDEQIKALYKRFSEEIRQQLLKKAPQLKENEALSKMAADRLVLKIIRELPPVAKPELFTPQDYQQVLNKMEPEINKTLASLGSLEKKITIRDKQDIGDKTLFPAGKMSTITKEFVSPEKLEGIKKSSRRHLHTFFIDSLTPKQRAEFEKIKLQLQQQRQQTSKLKLNPLFAVLYPKASFALAKKGFYALRIASLKLALSEIKKDYQPLIAQGLLPEDLQLTFNALKEMGLPQNSPVFQHLQGEINKFKDLEAENPRAFKRVSKTIIKYFGYERITGQREVYYQPLNMWFSLEGEADWRKGQNYASYLKGGLDRLQFISTLSQKTIKLLTKGKYKTLRDFVKSGLLRKTAAWFGKTAFGKALKSGLKKVGTKLAMKLGIAVSGAATGPPGWVVAVVSLFGDKIIALAKKAVSAIGTLIRDPGKAFAAILAGALVLVIIPMPFALIGIIPLSLGLIGGISFVAAPATIGAISGGISVFFSAIATLPVAAAVGSFIVIVMAALAGLTLFIVMTVSGAFILPSTIETAKEELISPYESEFFELTKEIEGNNKFDDPPGEVKYIITLKPKGDYVLIYPKISDKFSTSSEGNPPSIGSCNFDDLPGRIESLEIITLECIKNFGSGFENTAIINTINLNVEVEGKTGRYEGIASARVIIGDPPGDCPEGWPTNGRITQGPEGATSHCNYNPSKPNCHQEEAIDIANNRGTPVYATHDGTATLGEQSGRGAGYYVTISGTCEGVSFKTEYFHLANQGRKSGPVNQGDLIGYMSNSGTGGVHLHYEFRPKRPNEPFRMEPPYIPEAINRACNSSVQCNKTVVSEYDISR